MLDILTWTVDVDFCCPTFAFPIGLCPLGSIRLFVVHQNGNLDPKGKSMFCLPQVDDKILPYIEGIANGGRQKSTSKVDVKISNLFDFFSRKWAISSLFYYNNYITYVIYMKFLIMCIPVDTV